MSFKKINEEITRLERKLDLKRRLPGYFTQYVFHIGLVIILLFVAADFHLNGNSFQRFSVTCTSRGSFCQNPLYDCAHYSLYDNTHESCTKYDINRDAICDTGICDIQQVPNGFHIGRTDFLANNSWWLILLVLIMCFFVNHIIFFYKTGKHLPEWVE